LLSEVFVKRELEQVRIWARSRLQSGAVPEWSWQQHVNLIEAVDSILRDMAVLGAHPAERDRQANHLRLVRDAAARALTELSLEITEPAQYQLKTGSKRQARNLH
jgi:hypothetical protein